MEGEIKAELAQVNQNMKNLLEAVKQGALSMEQVKEENTDLQDAKRRVEKCLADLDDLARIEGEMQAILEVFDHDLENVLSELREIRLRTSLCCVCRSIRHRAPRDYQELRALR
jgi:DNA repair exonuclease SbcCD ATPase subunit